MNTESRGLARLIPTAPSLPSPRPKPILQLSDADLPEVAGLHLGEEITLRVRGRITDLRKEEDGDEHKTPRTQVTLRLLSITPVRNQEGADASGA